MTCKEGLVDSKGTAYPMARYSLPLIEWVRVKFMSSESGCWDCWMEGCGLKLTGQSFVERLGFVADARATEHLPVQS